MVKYSCIPARELSADLRGRWDAIQRSTQSFASPYFRPEFTEAVAQVRKDVYVGLIENDGEAVGFFPHHRKASGTGRPVGLALSDYHGVIAVPFAKWTAEGLLRSCKLGRWEFDHLPATQRQFITPSCTTAISPIIDLSGGFYGYENSRDSSARKQLREIRRKRERLAEHIGDVTFSAHTAEPDILRMLLRWKSEQCRRTGVTDFFAIDWCVGLVKQIHGIRGPSFGGILSCLRARETVVAIHFAMYGPRVWHSWFPAYDTRFREYSPGMILLLEMIHEAAERNISHIDLGKGMSLYKKRVMTDGISLAEGHLALPSIRNRVWKLQRELEQIARRSPLSPVLRIPGRLITRARSMGRYL